MALVISTELNVGYDKFSEVEKATRDILAEHGFGILTEIDAQETLKKKIDADIRPYKILGACNPPFAHKAIVLVPEIGALLPCNVIIYENENGRIVVSAMNPKEAMSVVKVDKLNELADEVNKIMKDVIKEIGRKFS
ncbi:MAG: DUF302 domain-containing protein [Candidatus Heimdallarchaeota archaeon]|nr:DUF302 domain-containing protein [Candidatus Heimdallarchaeota archaeon]MCG3255524.1 DUF302 domain-containing protein [Candidatus Heimdallarchaeota archaeon]MCK4610599.1 DUF302 domain-containing protein [Candidatus Heimdallarchaeota archaeon]